MAEAGGAAPPGVGLDACFLHNDKEEQTMYQLGVSTQRQQEQVQSQALAVNVCKCCSTVQMLLLGSTQLSYTCSTQS